MAVITLRYPSVPDTHHSSIQISPRYPSVFNTLPSTLRLSFRYPFQLARVHLSTFTMAIFSDLPNELVLCIWGYVIEPDDVESFALVSKRIYSLSSQFMNEHASLKRQYSKIWISYRQGNYEPADLLEKNFAGSSNCIVYQRPSDCHFQTPVEGADQSAGLL